MKPWWLRANQQTKNESGKAFGRAACAASQSCLTYMPTHNVTREWKYKYGHEIHLNTKILYRTFYEVQITIKEIEMTGFFMGFKLLSLQFGGNYIKWN